MGCGGQWRQAAPQSHPFSSRWTVKLVIGLPPPSPRPPHMYQSPLGGGGASLLLRCRALKDGVAGG